MEWDSKAAFLDFSQCKGLAEAAAQSASSGGRVVKKPKAASGGGGLGSQKAVVATCSVDGCESDLSGCREYHRRHKVCEGHAKTAVVMVGGKQQRFCQQCSRFHLLVEFDEGKRSCRKRLDCHNRRRRKPQTQSPLVYPRGGLLPGHHQVHHQGQLFAPYPDASQATRPKPDWGGVVHGDEDAFCLNFGSLNPTNEKTGPAPYPHLQHGRKPLFPFSQNNGAVITSGVAAATTTAETSNPLSSSRSSKLFLHQMNLFNPGRAPSLLSSPPPPPMQASSLLMAHVVPVTANPAPQAFQPPPPSLPRMDSLGKCASLQDPGAVSLTGLSCLDAESNEATAILVPDTGSSDFSSMPIFDVAGADGTSDDTSQDIPFYWH